MSHKNADQFEMPMELADGASLASTSSASFPKSPREQANGGPKKLGKKDPVTRRQPDVDLSATPAGWTRERWLKVGEVAERFGVSIPTIWRWRNRRVAFPQPITLSKGTTRWRLSDILAFERNIGSVSND